MQSHNTITERHTASELAYRTPSGTYLEKSLDLEDPADGDALRAGPPPELFSMQVFGVLSQYAAVGILYGTLPATIYPFFTNYLNMQGTQITSAKAILTLPWSLKAFYGILSDCVSIAGFRRRPFMLLGWIVAILFCFVMASMDAGPPYFPSPVFAKMNTRDYTPAMRATFNTHASEVGGKYLILLMFVAVGYVFADVAADGLLVEIAQREPITTRGRIQTAAYFVRTVFVTISNLFVGLAFNGEHYGGSFSFSLSFSQVICIVGIACTPIIPISWFCIIEQKHPGYKFKDYLLRFWKVLQTRSVYRVIAYKFYSGIFENFVATCSEIIERNWAHAEPLNEKIFVVIGNAVYATTLFCTGKYGLHWNWRVMHAMTLISVVILDSTASLLTVWNVLRSQWFWLGVPLAEYLPNAIGYIISAYVVVEIADEGCESALYGLVTASGNLSIPFSSTFAKLIDSNFDVKNEDIQADTAYVRQQVTYVYLIRYAVNLCGLLCLPLLPSQRAEAQHIKRTGGSSALLGYFTVTYLVFALLWSVAVSILSVFPSTSCLTIAGGSGCP